MECEVFTLDNKQAGKVELAEAVFGINIRRDILHRAVKWQLAKRQRGTHKVKERGEVRGTTARMYRQKGTGRARHGTKRVSQFVGGGVVFGPVVRSHAHDLPKKVRRLALKCALSSKQSEGKLVVLDAAVLEKPKTKVLATQISAFGWQSALIIDGTQIDANFQRAADNLPNIDVLPSQGANVYDILRRDVLVLTKAAVGALEERLK